MKSVFGYSSGDNKFEIFSHAGLFYLKDVKNPENHITLAKASYELTLRSYIDGFEKGRERGAQQYFDKYMELKQKIKKMESEK